MKKLIYSLAILVILVLCSNIVLAAENVSFGIGLTSSKTNVNKGDEITVTLKVKDFKNVTEGIYAFLATIEYDKNFFEALTESSVKGLGTWASVPTFNPNNGQITADSGTGVKAESDVFSITFKVKETAEAGKSTQIVVKNFEASEGEQDLKASADAKVTINVVKQASDGDNSGNNNTDNDNTNTGDNNNSNAGNNSNTNNGNSNSNTNTGNSNNSNNNSNKNNTATGKLPQTGEYDFIIFSLIGVAVVVASFGYFGYKKYNKI